MINKVICIDYLEGFTKLSDNSIDMIVTSPPYWLARKYGMDSGFGFESSPEEYIANYTSFFDESYRVLKPFGGLWLIIGDNRSQGKRRQLGRRDVDERGGDNFAGWKNWDGDTTIVNVKTDILAKSFMMIPEKIAIKGIERGFRLRDKIIWAKGAVYWDGTSKGGTTPSPHRDRFATMWEPIYYFTKDRYNYFNADAVEIKKVSENGFKVPPNVLVIPPNSGKESTYPKGSKNFATFPLKLLEILVAAGCPPVVCKNCGKPLEMLPDYKGFNNCQCDIIEFKRGIVLDPFMGSGTTAIASLVNLVDYIGFDIMKDQVEFANKRIKAFKGE